MSVLQKAQKHAEKRAEKDPEVARAVAEKRRKIKEAVVSVHNLLADLSGQVVKLPDGRRGVLQVYQTADCACVGIQQQELRKKGTKNNKGFKYKRDTWVMTGEDIGGWEVWPRKEGYSVQFDDNGAVSASKVCALEEQVVDYIAEQVGDVLAIEE